MHRKSLGKTQKRRLRAGKGCRDAARGSVKRRRGYFGIPVKGKSCRKDGGSSLFCTAPHHEVCRAMKMEGGKEGEMELKGREIRVSVRNLVEFVLRSGDIDNRRTAGRQREAMEAGSRLHRKIQKRMGPDYRAEVALKHRVEEEGFSLLIEGRADGILRRGNETVIDEIKGVYMDVSLLQEPIRVHLAQAMCYGYFYARSEGLAAVTVQVTYANLETEEIRRFQEEKRFEELEEWFSCLIHEYVKWARYLYHNALRRDESIGKLSFPFPYRKGQRDLAAAVYLSETRARRLFIQAPTGIGKTLSVVFPTLKAIGEGHGDKLFYLTAKTVTRVVAEEALELLRKNGLYFRSVAITAKEKLCILEKPECNPDACPRARGHFDRVNDAVFAIIHEEFGITRERILSFAEQFSVCPFEFCLDISGFVDGIICDYNYVFDPDVRLKRYFGEGANGAYFFLVDEAHNLVQRARQMYSASLEKEEVLAVKRLVKEKSPALAMRLERVNRILLELKRECESWRLLPDAGHLILALTGLFSELERFLDTFREFPEREEALNFYFTVQSFLNTYERLDGHYRIYTELLESGAFRIRLFCVNPIRNLGLCLEQGKSTVFFSATLLPLPYYRKLLSNEAEDYTMYVHSPFPPENRLILAACDVTSRYARRGEREYRKILQYIYEAAGARRGNYMVFFPSYQYMERVYELARSGPRRLAILKQESRMDEEAREAFLAEFDRERGESLAAFCVMGGLFSEGIDLTGERLIGVIVVGTGLPMVCTEQTVLKEYFDEAEQAGFSFAYQYPGMNKVLQAAGRVIRTASDRGVILLLDDRFLQGDYQALFPREWSDVRRVTLKTVGEELLRFWDGDFVEG